MLNTKRTKKSYVAAASASKILQEEDSLGDSQSNINPFYRESLRPDAAASSPSSTPSHKTSDENDDEENDILHNNIRPTTEGRIHALFETGFSFTKLELLRLIDGQVASTIRSVGLPARMIRGQSDQQGNQNSLIQELKTALKTVLEEVDQLKGQCVAVEKMYKEATIQATSDLKQSMNILFRLQQQTSVLEQVSNEKEKLTLEKMRLRDRIAMKDRERRVVEQELVERMKEIENYQAEISRLRDLLSSAAKHSVDNRGRDARFQRSSLASSGSQRESLSALGKLRDSLSEQQQTEKNLFHADLIDAINYIDDLRNELEELTEENARLKAELEIVSNERFTRQQSGGPMTSQPGDATSEDYMYRLQVEQRAEAERVRRVAAEEKLANAETDWNLVSEQVEAEMEAKSKKLTEVTLMVEEYIAANRDLAVRLEQTMAERDEAYSALRRSDEASTGGVVMRPRSVGESQDSQLMQAAPGEGEGEGDSLGTQGSSQRGGRALHTPVRPSFYKGKYM